MASPLAVFTIMAVRLASGLAHIAVETVILFGVLKLPIADGRKMASGKQLPVSAAPAVQERLLLTTRLK
jgi:hypothetical protein